MPEKVIIYGRDTWPYTNAAREAYAKKGFQVDYVNVNASSDNMEKMLKVSGGRKGVPVILEGGHVVFGYGGTWGV